MTSPIDAWNERKQEIRERLLRPANLRAAELYELKAEFQAIEELITKLERSAGPEWGRKQT